MTVTREQVLEVLRRVQDPDLHQDIVSLDFVTRCEVQDGKVDVTINLTTPACPMKDMMRSQAEQCIRELPGVSEVNIEMTAEVRGPSGPTREMAPGVKHFVAVSSGKGGVGKSTVTVNLAVALSQTGARVGILDCDVYGPDIPLMLGLSGEPQGNPEGKLVPVERYGLKTMSIGYLLPEDKPVVWRGPMVHSLINQFIGDVQWGELDYLLIDMPPGTGDAQLSLAQTVPLSGCVLVTTPQRVSTFDVTKSLGMFELVNVEILGLIENMTGLAIEGQVEGCSAGSAVRLQVGSSSESVQTDAEGRFRAVFDVFGEGGGQALASRFNVPLLGRIPLDPAVRVGGDAGDPVTVTAPDSPLARIFGEIAGTLAQRLSIAEHKSLPILQ